MGSMWQDLHCNQDPKWDKGSEQELIADEAGHHQQREQEPMLQQRPQKQQQNRDSHIGPKQRDKITTGIRHELIKVLKTSISEKGEADAKRRKFGPASSGKDQRALNWEVELAKDDLLQNGIHTWDPRSSINRVKQIEASNQELLGNRINKRQTQSIFNLAGKHR